MTTSTHLISHKIKQKMPMVVYGQPISLKSGLDQEESTIYITSWLDITSSLHMDLKYQKENTSIR
jgi:hypothetical protein